MKCDKIEGLIRIYNWTGYLTLFRSENYDAIYSKIGYLIRITCMFFTIFQKSKLNQKNQKLKQNQIKNIGFT